MQTVISRVHAVKSLAVVQLSTSVQDTVEYITCGKALAQKLIEVMELTQAGSVNTIVVLNHSDRPVFMMDGDILAGAKQNRVVNTSILLAPHSKTEIPVSCVEAGRWRHTSGSFSGTQYSAPSFLRAAKDRNVRESLKQDMGFRSNQAEIWDKVGEYQTLHKANSVTSNLSDVFEQKANDLEEMIKEFVPAQGSNGMAVFIGKSFATLDVFNRQDVFGEYFPKLLRGAAFEAMALPKKVKGIMEAEARYRTLELLDSLEHLEFENRPGVGLGTDRRYESKDMAGFELMLESELIHLAVFGNRESATAGKK